MSATKAPVAQAMTFSQESPELGYKMLKDEVVAFEHE